MIDLHSHILPEMDDGSASVEETLGLLEMSKNQGVQIIAATPHFYADRENPERFLQRRRECFAKLEAAPHQMQILLGAEVAFFGGMEHCQQLRQMTIGDSRLLLVEMPFSAWTNRMIETLCSMQAMLGVIPVLAHVERYLDRSQFPKYRDLLQKEGVLFQCNAQFFLGGLSSMRAMRMLKKGQIHFFGSDSHDLQNRPPKLGEAAQRIESKLGSAFLQEMDDFAREMLRSK